MSMIHTLLIFVFLFTAGKGGIHSTSADDRIAVDWTLQNSEIPGSLEIE